jgi:hypothetical protein
LIAGDEAGIWVVFKRIILGFFNLLFLNWNIMCFSKMFF